MRKGNFVAIGTFDPEIEIWSLDTLDVLYPSLILGGGPVAPPVDDSEEPSSSKSKKKKKKSKAKKASPQSSQDVHTDAILTLAWSPLSRSLLASGSADKTVKLWDLTSPSKAIRSLDSLHTDKVSCLSWNPTQPSVLMSGGFDGKVQVFDVRSPTEACQTFNLKTDIETLSWDPFVPHQFLAGTDQGLVSCWDARGTNAPSSKKGESPLWTLSAHDGPVTAMDISSGIPGLLVTGSSDKMVKIWNFSENRPSCVATRDLGSGHVFSAQFSKDNPLTLAVGGAAGKISLWNLESNPGVQSAFLQKVKVVSETFYLKHEL